MESFRINAKKQTDADRFYDNKYKRKKKAINFRTVFMALIFFLGGIVLTITGAIIHWTHTDANKHGLDIFVVGCIMLLPGSYACSLLYGMYKDWKGYSSDNLPAYD
jgi:hypothetical protein